MVKNKNPCSRGGENNPLVAILSQHSSDITKDHVKIIKALLEKKYVDPNQYEGPYMPLLLAYDHLKAEQRLGLFGLLLEVTTDTRILQQVLVIVRKKEQIESLLKAGADLNKSSCEGSYYLIKYLKAPGEDIYHRGKPGQIVHDHVTWLLKHGANPNLVDQSGATALTAVIGCHYAEIGTIELILEKSSQESIALALLDILRQRRERDSESFSWFPITQTSEATDLDRTEKLLRSKWNGEYNTQLSYRDGWTFFLNEVLRIGDKTQALELIESQGANPQSCDSLGRNAYHIAAAKGMLKIFQTAQAPLDVLDSCDHDGRSPLATAINALLDPEVRQKIENDLLGVVDRLIDQGASVDFTVDSGDHMATAFYRHLLPLKNPRYRALFDKIEKKLKQKPRILSDLMGVGQSPQKLINIESSQLLAKIRIALWKNNLNPLAISPAILLEAFDQLWGSNHPEWKRLASAHPALGELVNIYDEIVAGQTSTRRVQKFVALFSENQISEKQYRERFPTMARRWLQGLEEAKPLPQVPLFCHGTKSPVLAFPLDALYPAAALCRMGIAPLTGELWAQRSQSRRYHQGGISFASMDETWNKPSEIFFANRHGLGSGFLTARAYARRTRVTNGGSGANLSLTFNPERIRAIVEGQVRHLKPTSNKTLITLHIRQLKQVGYSLKLEATDCDIVKALQSKPVITLDPKDPSIASPFGLTFGAEHLPFNSTTSQSEVRVKTDVPFGSAIQWIFTDRDRIQQIKEKFSKMRVLSWNAGCAIEAVFMTRGATIARQKKKGPFERAAYIFHRVIAPFYARPFGSNPTYWTQNGKRVPVPNPFYGKDIKDHSDYLKAVDAGKILPRAIHGPMHAARTALWTEMLAESMQGEERYATVIGAGMHDAGREDEGEDRWDLDSGYLFYRLFQGSINDSLLKRVAASIQKKDAKTLSCVNQTIIHDADCLEIYRVAKETFDPKYLKTKVSTDLIEEVKTFITLTERPALKKAMFHHSRDYLGDLVRIVQLRQKSLPLMAKKLARAIKEMDLKQLLPSQILATL